MKLQRFLLVILGCGLLAACNLGGYQDGGYYWYGVGQKLGFAGIAFSLDGSIYGSDQSVGPIRYDPDLNVFRAVDVPGSLFSRYFVGDDGAEYVTDYGISTRAIGATQWTVMPESRSKRLEWVYAAKNGDVYARTGATPPAYFVRLSGSSAWTPLSEQPTQVANQPFSITRDFTGTTYLVNSSQQLMSLQGATATPLPQPDAQIFGFDGERYKLVTTGSSKGLNRVNAAGQLELWGTLGGGVPIIKYLGFGKDGRYYAIAGASSTLGAGFGRYDIIAFGKGASAWVFAASGVLNGDGKRNTLPCNTDAYNSAISLDGSAYFFGSESVCAGSGNMFSYGVYRLKF